MMSNNRFGFGPNIEFFSANLASLSNKSPVDKTSSVSCDDQKQSILSKDGQHAILSNSFL